MWQRQILSGWFAAFRQSDRRHIRGKGPAKGWKWGRKCDLEKIEEDLEEHLSPSFVVCGGVGSEPTTFEL
jgi:hypothetical protein